MSQVFAEINTFTVGTAAMLFAGAMIIFIAAGIRRWCIYGRVTTIESGLMIMGIAFTRLLYYFGLITVEENRDINSLVAVIGSVIVLEMIALHLLTHYHERQIRKGSK